MWLADRKRRIMKRLLIVFAGVVTAGVFGLAFVVDRFGQREQSVRGDAIIVLGARVLPGGVPSGALRARVEKAVALYNAGVAARLIFSGGPGDNGPTEAKVMRGLAVRLGVPESACLLEEESHSTDDNARFALKLVAPDAKLIVVSDPYHLLRARQVFRKYGREVMVAPALMSDRHITALDRCYWTCREAFALLFRPRLLVARAPRI